MPEENSFVRFHSGQYQFKVLFAIYTDFKAILKSLEEVIELYGSTLYGPPYTGTAKHS